jgi:hypothetical protein
MKDFTDYLAKGTTQIEKQINDPSLKPNALDSYKFMILKSLQGNYDDLEDYLNIQRALLYILELNQENIAQCLIPHLPLKNNP